MDKIVCQTCGANKYIKINDSLHVCQNCNNIINLNYDYNQEIKTLLQQGRLMQNALDFKMAKSFYLEALKIDNTLHEAYFGMFISDYGIEYILDKNNKFIPTCHKASSVNVYDNSNFQNAINYADQSNKEKYINLANEYEVIRKKLLEQSNKIDDFDIFICYKSKNEYNHMTKEHEFCLGLYYELKDKKKVFFADKTLDSYAGMEYEPIIFKALQTSKVMLLVAFSLENINSVWVKNEWQRFLEFKSNEEKRLVLLYKDIDINNIPVMLQSIQHIDCNKFDYIDSIRNIFKENQGSIKSDQTSKEHFKEVNKFIIDEGTNEDKKMQIPLTNLANAYTFLNNKQFTTALTFFRLALKENKRDCDIYFGILKSQIECDEKSDIKEKILKLNDFTLFENTLKYAKEDRLNKYINIFTMCLYAYIEKNEYSKVNKLFSILIKYINNDVLISEIVAKVYLFLLKIIKIKPKDASLLLYSIDRYLVNDAKYIKKMLDVVKEFRRCKKFKLSLKIGNDLLNKTRYISFEYEIVLNKYKISDDQLIYKIFSNDKKIIELNKVMKKGYDSIFFNAAVESVIYAIKKGKVNIGELFFNNLIKFVPNESSDCILFNERVADILLFKGKFEEAKNYYNKISLSNGNKNIYLKLVMCNCKVRDVKKLKKYSKFLKNDPNYKKYIEFKDIEEVVFKK